MAADYTYDYAIIRVVPRVERGEMINVGINFVFYYWHMAVFPTAFLAITVLATTLFGDGLRDALDPKDR